MRALWAMCLESYRRYFDAAGVSDERERIIAHTLMRAYGLGAVLMGLVVLFNLVFLGVQGHQVKILTQLSSGMGLVGLMELTRRGHTLWAGWIFGALTWALVVHRTLAMGELNAMICTLILPIIVLSFGHTKRSVLLYIAFSYLTLTSLALGLSWTRAIDAPPTHYALSTTIFTLTVILLDVFLVTWLVMSVERDALRRVSESTQAMEQAQREAMEQSVEAERTRHEVLLTKQAKARYLANMSHELRTPLSTIISYSELLHESFEELPDAPERTRRDVALIKNAGEHVLRRINDILDLSRLEAGKMPLREEPVLLSELFEQADRFARERASINPRARLKITWPAPDQLEGIEVLCDELLMVKLFAHLILHLKQDGPISVFVVPRDAQLDVVFKLRVWTIPPESHDMATINPSHLHLLLYRALLDALEIPFEEPTGTHNRPWKLTLNTL